MKVRTGPGNVNDILPIPEITVKVPNLSLFTKYVKGSGPGDSWPGVYALLEKGVITYIGQTSDVTRRMAVHYSNYKRVDGFLFRWIPSKFDREFTEKVLICVYKPVKNGLRTKYEV
jgi:hypothetical protein